MVVKSHHNTCVTETLTAVRRESVLLQMMEFEIVSMSASTQDVLLELPALPLIINLDVSVFLDMKDLGMKRMENVPLASVTRMKNANQMKNADTFLLDKEIVFLSVMEVSVVDRTHFVLLAIMKEFVSVRKALKEFLLIPRLDVVPKINAEMTTIAQIMKSVV